MEELQAQIKSLDDELRSPKSLALLRMKLLDGGSGFPSFFLPMIRDSVKQWLDLLLSSQHSAPTLSEALETKNIFRVLDLCKKIAEMDPTLSEEVGREGSHALLAKLIKVDGSRFAKPDSQDTIMEIQDITCEIASMSNSFPLRVAPFTMDELFARLPLSFPIFPANSEYEQASRHVEHDEGLLVLINQVTVRQSAQKDVGFVMWPSAVALSRWLVTNPHEVSQKNVLELGAGCGLVGLIAARLKATQLQEEDDIRQSTVILTDFNKLVVENIERNISLNNVETFARGTGLDFYEQNIDRDGWLDSDGTEREQVDLILASDIICQPEDAFAAARTIFCALRSGGKAIMVSADSKHRFGVECFEDACLELGLRISSIDVKDLYNGQLLCKEMEKTSGYVDCMKLTMYTVDKVS